MGGGGGRGLRVCETPYSANLEKAKCAQQSHHPPGNDLCSVLFAMCKTLKIFSVLVFRSLYCIFDHLGFLFVSLILEVQGEERIIKKKNERTVLITVLFFSGAERCYCEWYR